MPEVRGQLLPVYVLVDESLSMKKNMAELNGGLTSLYEALLGEPMAAAKVRFSVLGFSDDVAVRLHLADLRSVAGLPALMSRGTTDFRAAFEALLRCIPDDVAELKAQQYQVHRPAVFFLSDGQPSYDTWRDAHRRLVDHGVTAAAPNIIACGIGEAEARTIIDVATRPEFAFVAVKGTDVGQAISRFCTSLTTSIVASGRSLSSGNPELVVDRPEGFRMAIDVI